MQIKTGVYNVLLHFEPESFVEEFNMEIAMDYYSTLIPITLRPMKYHKDDHRYSPYIDTTCIIGFLHDYTPDVCIVTLNEFGKYLWDQEVIDRFSLLCLAWPHCGIECNLNAYIKLKQYTDEDITVLQHDFMKYKECMKREKLQCGSSDNLRCPGCGGGD